MLSYRHAFHAGNAPDILKHAVLLFCLAYLGKKEKPLLCIDTHGGAGQYDLTQGYAMQNREWEQGIGPLLKAPPEALPPLIRPLVALVRKLNPLENPASVSRYPGSSAIMASLLREQDRQASFELHPTDFAQLEGAFRGRPHIQIRREDGLAALKARLPPLSRRALVFIDPSYELKEDYRILPEALTGALGRFPTGCYIIWYPLLGRNGAGLSRDTRDFPELLWSLYRGNRLRAELYTGTEVSETRGLYGSGLVVYNPPWPLGDALAEALPFLGARLGNGSLLGKGGGWDLLFESGGSADSGRNPGPEKGSYYI
jgi:23S rRNA (adenine2030-N6)-methyltransferase